MPSDRYQPAHVMNQRAHPRILLIVEQPKRFAWIQELAGTYRFISELSEVDTDEWDVLITDGLTAQYSTNEYGRPTAGVRRIAPTNLWLFRILTEDSHLYNDKLIDFGSPEGRDLRADDKKSPLTRLLRDQQVPGHLVRRIDGLTEVIQDQVKAQLLPAVEKRDYQFGVRIPAQGDGRGSGLREFRPFLTGPSDLVLACSYIRIDGGQGWIVPDDVPDFRAWFELALNDWHVADPRRFPAAAAWQTADAWMTERERALSESLDAEQRSFEALRLEHERKTAELREQLEVERVKADAGRRLLLTGQGEALQAASLEALTALGFLVQDMDLEWYEKERREDFRIRDDDEPGWLVIADVTGSHKGGRAAKLQTITGYVSKFILQEKPDVMPGQWVILNRLIERDPELRGELFRADELAVFSSQAGLAIDTVALFVIVESCATDADRGAARSWLRSLTGEVTLRVARDWLAAQGLVDAAPEGTD